MKHAILAIATLACSQVLASTPSTQDCPSASNLQRTAYASSKVYYYITATNSSGHQFKSNCMNSSSCGLNGSYHYPMGIDKAQLNSGLSGYVTESKTLRCVYAVPNQHNYIIQVPLYSHNYA